MKSLAERKKDKEEQERRERMKRSTGEKRYMQFGIPVYGFPYIETDGDIEFLKKKANDFILKCSTFAPYQFYDFLKEAIAKKEKANSRSTGQPLPDWLQQYYSSIDESTANSTATLAATPAVPATPPVPIPTETLSEPIGVTETNLSVPEIPQPIDAFFFC